MTTTTELVKRLEAGETGREIDALIWYTMVEKPGPGEKIDRDMIDRWPAYTTSLDAAVALVERVLPEGTWSIDHHRKDPCYAGVRKDDWTPPAHAYAPAPAAALVAALLKAGA